MTEEIGSVIQGVDEKQLVVFDLADEAYGVDIGSVREIISMQEITQVPRTPEFVQGVIDLRGRVIPVIDMRKRFGFPVPEHTKHTKDTRIVVIDIGATVDAVSEVLRVSSDSIEPPSAAISTEDSDCLLGIAKLPSRLIIILDLKRLLSAEELALDLPAKIPARTSPGVEDVREAAPQKKPGAPNAKKAGKPKAKKPATKQKARA